MNRDAMKALPYVLLHKEVGQTPLACIDAWRVQNPQWKDIPASYAGRLDPMAEGKLLVLLGDECKKQSKYTKLDKEYEIEITLDVSTDTGDVLGLATRSSTETRIEKTALRAALHAQEGTHVVEYPIFSSKTVSGKPLFLYALEGTIDHIEIPTHEEHIYRIALIDEYVVSREDLQKRIIAVLAKTPRTDEPSKKLGADFRIDAITAQWNELFATLPPRNFTILRLRVICASGTYMRTLANRIGATLGTTGLALSINRTQIGSYCELFGGYGFWRKRY